MAFELITVLIVLAAILVALRPGVLLNSVYAFAEIMNMQSIRESLDNEDPASYEYYQQLASVSDNNYYMIEVFDPDGNTVYSNREKFLYSGDGDSVYYRTAESMYTTGRSVRVFDLFDDSASFDEYEYQDSEASGYYRYRVELKNGDTLRLWLPYYQVERNAHTASFLLTAFALISAAVACAIILIESAFLAPACGDGGDNGCAMAKRLISPRNASAIRRRMFRISGRISIYSPNP